MEIIEGRYVGAGDKNVYVKIDGLGDPPVVIETGLGGLSVEWSEIQSEIANHTTVITYDRAGYGESPKGQLPRTSRQISIELFDMLSNTEVPGPYIFVGHSSGGLYLQNFVKMFPREAAGLILVDSITTNYKQLAELDAPTYQERASLDLGMNNIKKLLELEDEQFEGYTSSVVNDLFRNFPKIIADQMIIYQSDKKFYETIIDEYNSLYDSCEIVKSIPDFPNIPLLILNRDYEIMIEFSKQIGITEDEARAVEELWLRLNKELTGLSNQSEFKIVKGSSHFIHLTRPDAIIQEILKMMEKVR
jgi:pimeloyl-ACP methyl ester carboxylesterase